MVHYSRMIEKPDTQFKVRLPDSLKKRLEMAAAQSGTSITAELVARLERSFPDGVMPLIAENRRREVAVVESQIEEMQQHLSWLRESFAIDVTEHTPADKLAEWTLEIDTFKRRLEELRHFREHLAHEADSLSKPRQP